MDKSDMLKKLEKAVKNRKNKGKKSRFFSKVKNSNIKDTNLCAKKTCKEEQEWNPVIEIAKKEIDDLIDHHPRIIEVLKRMDLDDMNIVLSKKEGSMLEESVECNYKHIAKAICNNTHYKNIFIWCVKSRVILPEITEEIKNNNESADNTTVLPDDPHKKEHLELSKEMKKNRRVFDTSGYHTNPTNPKNNFSEIVKIDPAEANLSKTVAVFCFFGIFILMIMFGIWSVIQTGNKIDQKNAQKERMGSAKKSFPLPQKYSKPTVATATSKKSQTNVSSLAIATETFKPGNFQHIFPGAENELNFSVIELPKNISSQEQIMANNAMKELADIKSWWQNCSKQKLEQYMLQKRLEEYSNKYKELFLEIKLKKLKRKTKTVSVSPFFLL